MNKVLLSVCLMLLLIPARAQQRGQEATVLFYNVGLGSLTSAIGAAINTPKGGDWKQCFVRGLWRGGIGGGLNYAGKKVIYQINRNEQKLYGWPAKLLHSAGLSIMEGAALNEPFLQHWHMDFGPVRFDFSTNGSQPFRARLLPQTFYAVYAAGYYGTFDLGTTLATGQLAFVNHDAVITTQGLGALGIAYGRAFVYVDHPGNNQYWTVGHEIVHIFQYSDCQILNTWLRPLERRLHSKVLHAAFSKYIYFDAPYFQGIYELEGRHSYAHYYRNFFEFEAERFSSNRYVPVH